jgi:hypothetical protein
MFAALAGFSSHWHIGPCEPRCLFRVVMDLRASLLSGIDNENLLHSSKSAQDDIQTGELQTIVGSSKEK